MVQCPRKGVCFLFHKFVMPVDEFAILASEDLSLFFNFKIFTNAVLNRTDLIAYTKKLTLEFAIRRTSCESFNQSKVVQLHE